MNAFTDIQIEAQVAPPERPKTPEQIAHIDAVIALIEGEETTFDMNTWLNDAEISVSDLTDLSALSLCGTVACIGGHSDLVAGHHSFSDARTAKRFGMSYAEGIDMFYGYLRVDRAITRADAIRALKHIRAGHIFSSWKDFLEDAK